jgi:hypothetical protein
MTTTSPLENFVPKHKVDSLTSENAIDALISVVDDTIKLCGRTHTVLSSEMMDALLDIRNTILTVRTIVKVNESELKGEITNGN